MKTLEVLNIGYKAFCKAMELSFCDGYGDSKDKDAICDSWYLTEKNELVLSVKNEKGTKLPFMMSRKETIDFAWGFICANDPYEKQGGGDGTYSKGFRVSDNVGYSHYGDLVKVSPAWIYYGK